MLKDIKRGIASDQRDVKMPRLIVSGLPRVLNPIHASHVKEEGRHAVGGDLGDLAEADGEGEGSKQRLKQVPRVYPYYQRIIPVFSSPTARRDSRRAPFSGVYGA